MDTQFSSTPKIRRLENAIFRSSNDDFDCKIARKVEEATELIELSFEYASEINRAHLYRKMK